MGDSSPKSYHTLTPCKLVGKDQSDLWNISDEGNTIFGQINDGVIENHIMGSQININSITSNNNILIGEIDNYESGNVFQNDIPNQCSEEFQHFENHNNDNIIIFNNATNNDGVTSITNIADQTPEFTNIIENNILHHNSNSDQIENEVVLLKSKKRKSFGSLKEASKKKRNMGQSYHTANKKKLINAKEIQLACGNICRLKCSLSISEISRQQLFNSYWQLGNVDRQRDFLSKCIEPGNVPKYRYPHTVTRDLNYSYNFCINNIKHRVCKLFFKNTLAISDRPIRTVISRLNNYGFIKEDKCGKHKNHKKT
ncbi:GATA zinc finger domain-containing protein 4-like [Metopolophium dirhodum]|uniref:GATA zinc finger domain-containing protein 4-like n=1 Tax=Metopolophium dirhodum TaxID=44670 RepID=UPI00298F933F|nr:GATA zinc finger domain-containing protein 4-like [Metopolophium dirhodum]